MFDHLQEFAAAQQDLGAKVHAATVRKMDLPPTPIILLKSDGAVIPASEIEKGIVRAPVAPRKYNALTLSSFCAIVNEFAGRPPSDLNPDKPTVFLFVSMTAAVAVLDEADRRDTVTFPLAVSSTWSVLKALREGSAMTQAQIIDLLRRRLDARIDPENLLTSLRSVKFKSDESGESTIQNGRASIGKSVQAELTGASALPEDVVVEALIWDNVQAEDAIPEARRAPVDCALDIDLAEQKFYLRPKAGEIESHETAALEWLVGAIIRNAKSAMNENVKVFAGSTPA